MDDSIPGGARFALGREMTAFAEPERRRLLLFAATAVAASLSGSPASAARRLLGPRRLAFQNLHTGEALHTVYWANGDYLPDALRDIDWLLRDFRTDEVRPIDPRLLDLLRDLQARLGTRAPFQVISAYRSPETNAMLAQRSDGVAQNSLHMQGMAIDIRVPGRLLNQVRDAAQSFRAGGVGYYPQSDFVHIDTGPARRW
jgi:uncharacterized protein YcbK (DUF882 family)